MFSVARKHADFKCGLSGLRAFLKSGDESESVGGMSVEKASGMRKIGVLGFGKHQANHEIVEASHYMSSIAFRHTGAVFS